MIAHLPLLDLMYKCTTNGLNKDQDVYSNTNAMMWVCQTSAWTYSKVAKDEDDSGENDSEDLERNVYSKGQSWVLVVEAGNEDGGWYNAEEGDGSDDSMSGDYRLVLFQ